MSCSKKLKMVMFKKNPLQILENCRDSYMMKKVADGTSHCHSEFGKQKDCKYIYCAVDII